MDLETLYVQVNALERRVDKIETCCSSLDMRLGAMEKTQAGILDIRLLIERLSVGNDNTTKSFAEINARLDKMDDKLTRRIEGIDSRLANHEKKPGEKWEKATWAVVIAVIGGVVGFFLQKVLL